jgi:hypothetical protein
VVIAEAEEEAVIVRILPDYNLCLSVLIDRVLVFISINFWRDFGSVGYLYFLNLTSIYLKTFSGFFSVSNERVFFSTISEFSNSWVIAYDSFFL